MRCKEERRRLLPADQARRDLSQGILARAAAGQDIRPSIQSALSSHTLTLPQARHLITESRLSPLQQRLEPLPLFDALNVYKLGSPAEQAAWAPVMLRKLASAARSRSLTAEQVRQAQSLGLGPKPR